MRCPPGSSARCAPLVRPRRAAAILAGLLAAMLLASTGASGADRWTQVVADNGIFSAWADRATISRRGSFATMRGLYDFPRGDLNPDGVPYASTTVEREYDCRERRVRMISHVDHAGRFASGSVVSAADWPPRWETIVEDSVDEAFWKIACAGA